MEDWTTYAGDTTRIALLSHFLCFRKIFCVINNACRALSIARSVCGAMSLPPSSHTFISGQNKKRCGRTAAGNFGHYAGYLE